MKRLISLGVVSTMVASMSAVSFAQTTALNQSKYKIGELEAYVVSNNATSLKGANNVAKKDANGNQRIDLTCAQGDEISLVFGASVDGKRYLFAGVDTKTSNEIVQSARKNAISYKKISGSGAGEFSSNTRTIDGVNRVNSLKFKISNTTTKDKSCVWELTVQDIYGNIGKYTLNITATGVVRDDVSNVDVEPVDGEDYREYKSGAAINNGQLVTAAEIKFMVGKGNYLFYNSNGINLLTSATNATPKEDFLYRTSILTDSVIEDRYNIDSKNKIFTLDVPAFSSERNRKINIDCDNSNIQSLFGSALIDDINSGKVKKMYVYSVNTDGYNTLSKASTFKSDGIIDQALESASIEDSKVVFSVPKGVTKVVISTQEIDTTGLPAVAGVSVSEDVTSAANEITAPIVATNESTSNINIASATTPITAPEVVSAPVLTEKPAATNAGTQNTGVARGMVACACAAIMAMAAAVVTTVSKKSFKRF